MRTMPSTPSTSTLLRSTLLRGAAIAVALTLPAQARAGWGENWGTMLWGQSASVPVPGLEWFGLLVLALGLLATTAWTLRKRWPALGLPVLLVLLALPVVVVASTITMPHAFVNGTPADANQMNANFDSVKAAVDDNDSRITTIETTPPPAGPTGPTGAQGPIGLTGPSGADGTNGTDGLDGAPGANGTNGNDGLAGVDGAAGADGAQGLAGADGAAGAPGTNGTNGTDGAPGTNGTDGLAVAGLVRIQQNSAFDFVATKSAFASCPVGTKVLGGGYLHFFGGPTGLIRTNAPTLSLDGWVVSGTVLTGASWSISAFALCANAP